MLPVYLVSWKYPPDPLATGAHKHVKTIIENIKYRPGFTLLTSTVLKRKNTISLEPISILLRTIKRKFNIILNLPLISDLYRMFRLELDVFSLDIIMFSIIAFTKIIKKGKKGIVHTHGFGLQLTGILSKIFLDYPFVMTLHDTRSNISKSISKFDFNNTLFEIIEKISFKFADKVICVSNQVKKEAIKAGCPPNKIEVIYNSTDNKPKKGKKGDYFLFVGGVDYGKGYDLALSAFKKFKKKNKNKHLVIIGIGSETIKPIPRLIPLSYITGDLKENLFKNSFAILMPSRYDSCPTALLEALSYGKPVITTRGTGASELVTQNGCGIVTGKRGDLIAKAMLKLENKKLYNKFSKNAISSVKKFNAENMNEPLLEIYYGAEL